MLNDRLLIWILEYILGGTLVVVPLTSRILCLPALAAADLEYRYRHPNQGDNQHSKLYQRIRFHESQPKRSPR